MSTGLRKYRKRVQRELRDRGARDIAASLFQRRPKVGTPLSEAAFVTNPVYRKPGDAIPQDSIYRHNDGIGILSPRSALRVQAFLASGGRTRGSKVTGKAAQR